MEQRMPQRWFSPRALMDELGDMNWLSNPSGLQISEDATHVLVEASLPGLTEGEIDITYEKGTLMVRGEKQETEDDKNKKFYRRSSRSFFYQMAVPENVDDSVEPKAEFKNGVAIISFSKKKKEQPKKITFNK
ncbi:MAG: Hsp20/alpha crystallin family protein [Verrucomicrobia bacterium]|nr:Hsp20/alpha crystallin family protein [Verrucomicrobiota bacterium]